MNFIGYATRKYLNIMVIKKNIRKILFYTFTFSAIILLGLCMFSLSYSGQSILATRISIIFISSIIIIPIIIVLFLATLSFWKDSKKWIFLILFLASLLLYIIVINKALATSDTDLKKKMEKINPLHLVE